MEIPFLDLKAQYITIKPEIDEAIKRVLDRQFFVLGPELEAFELEFAKYIDVRYCVGVNSGTDALILSLLALNVGKGDEVIIPANTFIATATAISYTGATSVLVDCDPITYEIDVREVQKAITSKTKVIVPVHLFGAPAPMDEILNIANRKNIFVVEDAAQAHGTLLHGKKMGTFGDLAAFSFYPGKNLGAYGDGGAIVTNDKRLYEKLLKLRNHGQTEKYIHEEIGYNSRLDEIQAAVLRVKLRHLDDWNRTKRQIAKKFNSSLIGYKTQKIIKVGKSNYYVFVIENDKREILQKYLLENGIHTLIHYPIPIHLQNAYKFLGYKKGDFPVAEELAEKILSIPIYPELDRSKQEYIIEILNNF